MLTYCTRPWPLHKLLFQRKFKVYFHIAYCLQVFVFLITCIWSGFSSKILLSLSFLFRVLGKQLLLPKEEGFQHFQSRSDTSVDTKCLSGLHECTSNIKEYVNVFKFSFWSSIFRNMYKYYFCITETFQYN